MLRRTAAAFTFGLVLSSSISSTALAEDDAPAEAPTEAPTEKKEKGKPEESWYGWQTLLVDVAAIALVSQSGGPGREGLAWAALGTYALGPPLVHLAHGAPGKAGISVAMRVLAPVVGGAVGFGGGVLLGGGDGLDAALLGALGLFVGVTVGYAGAVATDAGALAREGR